MKQVFIPMLGLLATSPAVAADSAEQLTEETVNVNNTQNLKEKVSNQVRELRKQQYTCSQATFTGICKTLGSELTDEQLMAISAGFAGGIGRSYNEGSCGALVAGTMALGIYLPGENEKTIALSKELFEHFKQQEGTVICGNITQKHGFSRCTGCCACVAEKVTELLQRENMIASGPLVISWDSAIAKLSNS